jgi:hypothetical protein
VRGRELTLESSSPLSGIIFHLSSTRGGNVSDLGVVGVTASSSYESNVYMPKFATEMNTDRGFGSAYSPDPDQ